MHIVLDAMGGDNAPDVNIDGAIAALEKKKDLVISLTGPEALLREKLSEKRFDADRLLVVDAPQVITNDETPVMAVRKKRDSSIVVGVIG